MPTLQELSSMFDSGNYGLLDRGLQAQTTGQQRQEADLASVLQKTQQDAAMHPLEMQYKQASTGNLNAQSRNSNALAADHEDKLKVLQSVPMNARVQDQMNQYSKNATAAEMEQMKAHMDTAAWASAEALNNGGVLPITAQARLRETHPEIFNYFKRPDGAQILANMVTSFNALQPDRQRADSGHTIAADASKYSADRGYDKAFATAEMRAELEAQKAKLKTQYDNNPIHRITALITARQAAVEKNDPAQVALIDREIAAQTPVAALAARAFAPVGGVDIGTQGGVATNPVPSLVPKDGGKQGSNVVTPKTKAEYDAIPKGTTYVDTDGIKKIKG
jgi:hypothetical protein